MLKNYGIERKKTTEKILYKITQMQYFLLKYCARSDGMRDYYKHAYQEFFTAHTPDIRHNYSVPKGKHCKPVCLITSDLILRENLPPLKKGLVKLLKKHYSHKFLGGFKSIDQILTAVENMDDSVVTPIVMATLENIKASLKLLSEEIPVEEYNTFSKEVDTLWRMLKW